uniref:GRF1-interacting factor 1 n=1 Tax=Tanacetum cinerariifolium TaxID=118510 RepID=A0A6L2NFY8_TANCI|nr:GRF1-interacting factor 1 [Tanacetum cinerariifolium]
MMQQQGGHYMQQHQQAQQMSLQALMAARSSILYSQQQYSALQQQAMHNHLGMSSSVGLHMLQKDSNNTAGGGGHFASFDSWNWGLSCRVVKVAGNVLATEENIPAAENRKESIFYNNSIHGIGVSVVESITYRFDSWNSGLSR